MCGLCPQSNEQGVKVMSKRRSPALPGARQLLWELRWGSRSPGIPDAPPEDRLVNECSGPAGRSEDRLPTNTHQRQHQEREPRASAVQQLLRGKGEGGEGGQGSFGVRSQSQSNRGGVPCGVTRFKPTRRNRGRIQF